MQDAERATPPITPDLTRTGHPGDPGRRPGVVDSPDDRPDARSDGTPDVDGPAPGDREAQRRDEPAERAGTGGPSPAGRDRPDLVPDLEPPDLPM